MLVWEWLRKAPTAVTVTVIAVTGLLGLGVLAAYVILSANGVDTADFRQWVQTLGILVIGPLVGVNTVTGLVSAKSASRAEDQTNGQLTARDARIATLEDQVKKMGGTP